MLPSGVVGTYVSLVASHPDNFGLLLKGKDNLVKCFFSHDFLAGGVRAASGKEIGADAIIICQAGQNQGLPGLPPSPQVQAVVIKYKLTGGSS